MQARGADGAHGVLRTRNTNYACWVKRRLAIATLLALALVPVPPAGAADPRVRDVAAALDHDPVYVAPSQRRALSPAAARRLRRQIARLDKGRIQIAVVPLASADRVGGIESFGNAVDQAMPNRRGTLIATTGLHFQIVTSHTGVGTTLAAVKRAVNKYHGLPRELAASVDGVAEVDPGPGQDVNGPPASAGTNNSTPSSTPSSSSGGGSNAGEIVGIIFAALVLIPLLIFAVWMLLRWGSRRKAASQMEELDLGTTRDELLALGQDIEDLDLDTQMPNANPGGVQEYQRALMLYDRANRALKDKDPSQLQIGEARRCAEEGRAHIQAAKNLLASPAPGTGGETVHPES